MQHVPLVVVKRHSFMETWEWASWSETRRVNENVYRL